MKPTELDESLLTAYLDDELSVAERELVEQHLKTNESWQQLLLELESVRLLVRTLPTHVLSRPIADGPWNTIASNIEANTRNNTKDPDAAISRSPFIQLAFAASLLVGGFATIAWLRSGGESFQIAKSIQESASETLPQESPRSSASTSSQIATQLLDGESGAVGGGMIARNGNIGMAADSNFAMKLGEFSDEKKSELAKDVDPAPKFQMQAGLTAAEAILPEPVETYYTTQKNLPSQFDKRSLKEAAGAVSEIDDRLFSYVEQRPASEGSKAKYLWKPLGKEFASATRTSLPLTLSAQRQFELCFQRSEWPMVATELGKMGIQLPNPKSNGSEYVQDGSDGPSKSKRDATLSVSPPTLVGAIDEPTDWIRVVVNIESR